MCALATWTFAMCNLIRIGRISKWWTPFADEQTRVQWVEIGAKSRQHSRSAIEIIHQSTPDLASNFRTVRYMSVIA